MPTISAYDNIQNTLRTSRIISGYNVKHSNVRISEIFTFVLNLHGSSILKTLL